jgi:hypothetical protein
MGSSLLKANDRPHLLEINALWKIPSADHLAEVDNIILHGL